MAKQKTTDRVRDILKNYIEENSLEIWNIEFVKEGSDWFLRVYIDKKDYENGGVSLDDCEGVSRHLSEKLDEDDFIEQNYYLEVSSPGLERELIEEEHFVRYIGEKANFRLFEAIDKTKKFDAKIVGVSKGVYTLQKDDGQMLEIPRDKIAKAKLIVEF